MQGGTFTGKRGNQWYILYPCYDSDQSILFTQVSEFATHLNTIVEVYDEVDYNYLGCYTVKVFSGTPPAYATVNNNIVYDGSRCDPCNSYCISVGGGTGYVKYINYNDVETTASLPAKICTKTKPFVSISTPIIKPVLGDCEDGCNISCYELTNCTTGQIIYSNNQSLFSAYADNKTVTLNELPGCWTVSLGIECECFEDVSINLSYSSCQTCLPIVAYTLTNCENPLMIKYSEEDLSQYVDKIVSLDCGDCWTVQEINYKPPQTQQFVIENAYESCEQCSRAYWILYDCNGQLAPITTFTDMTEYGTNILKLAGYPSCWSIQTSPTPDYENAVGVSVVKQFEECADCLLVTGCKCTRVKNTTEQTLTYSYKDCTELEHSFSLVSGASSPKICVNQWIESHPNTDLLSEFGDCITDPNNAENKICPADISGRMVKPGYNTPNCNTEKFERVTCETAEVLYKQVLQLRYGISNCCPENDEKLILEKEVIDLQSLNDPNFECPLPSTCCSTTQCSCGNCIS